MQNITGNLTALITNDEFSLTFTHWKRVVMLTFTNAYWRIIRTRSVN